MNHPEDEEARDFRAFKQAYMGIPSQDDEGYVPDRGGFKCGWYAALRYVRTSTEWKAMEEVIVLAEKHTNFRCTEWDIENDFDVTYTEHKESCRLCALQHAIEELDRIRKEGESG